MPAVHTNLTLLSTKALAIRDRQPYNVDFGKSCFDTFQLLRLDDCDDQFHGEFSSS